MADLKDVRLEAINNALDYVLSSEELKRKWWTSKNKAFNGETPEAVYKKDPSSVAAYIMQILSH